MTAGRGIIHSEMPVVTQGDLWGFQLWINLPRKDKMVKPRCVLGSAAPRCCLVTQQPATLSPPGKV